MKKFTIKKNKAKLSDQEISQQMNFDKFISGYTPPVKGWLSGGTKLYTIIASTSAALLVAGYLIYSVAKKNETISTPFVDPPLQSMNSKSTDFNVNTNADSTIVYSTGSMITVPSNAFIDADGKDVKGDVQLHYREFHDPIDIMLSGIPMNYDSAGVNYQLESAGMFELTATKDGQPVTLKPGKQLLVNMVSHTNNPTDYNIYNLDTLKKKWEYVSENTTENKTCIPIFQNKDKTGKSINTNEQSASAKPILPKRSDPATDNFSIDFNKAEFPELAVYNGLKFEPVKGEKKYDAALSKKIWDDVLIERHPDNEHYIVTFTKGKESHSFTVSPVVDENGYAAMLKDFASRQKKYEAVLAMKKNAINRRNDSLYEINSEFKSVALKSNLNERFNSFIDDNYMGATKDMLVYRLIPVTTLGVWNSDKPYPFFSKNFKFNTVKGEHVAEFVSANGQPIDLKCVYMMRRSVNFLFCVVKSKFDHFPFYENSVDVMVGITDENELFYMQDQELQILNEKDKTLCFKMNKMDEKIVSSKQLKNLLKI